MTMAHTYRAAGSLTEPVSDIRAANEYLKRDDMTEYVKYSDLPHPEVVHHIEWSLVTEGHWEVTVITDRALTDEESEKLSEWISGQNSDGLGEGFEQQAFAEHGSDNEYSDDYDEEWSMSSFDWEVNDCKLTLIK